VDETWPRKPDQSAREKTGVILAAGKIQNPGLRPGQLAADEGICPGDLESAAMLSTKRLLLGLLVLGIVGMHALVTSSGTTAAHHGWSAAAAAHTIAASTTAGHATAEDATATATVSAGEHAATAMTSHDLDGAVVGAVAGTLSGAIEEDGAHTTALALCMALLLAFGVVALAGRRTTWVADASTRVGSIPLPLPPVLRDSSPVPRFTVMRC
jgi:hypothetical protein